MVLVVVVVVVVVVGGNQIYRWDLNTGMERPSWARPQKKLVIIWTRPIRQGQPDVYFSAIH